MAETGPVALDQQQRTSPVELLWDLVFVFAVTRVTTLLAADLSWAGFGRSMLVLALVWWAWSAFVWVAEAQQPDSPTLRLCLLLATVCIFITGLSIPGAFAAEGLLFAASYGIVRGLHLLLYADASRRGNASWSAIAGFGVTVIIGLGLLVLGAFTGGLARVCLWAAAVAIDYAGPGWLTRNRLRGLQRVAVAHFAERYGLFVIICLGESIVAIGLAAGSRTLSFSLVAAVSLGLLVTVEMWWTYFDRFAETAERRLREHTEPVLAASDAYSYLHLAIIAGIIIFAVGIRSFVASPIASPLAGPPRLTLCGGVCGYLIGHVAADLRMTGSVNRTKLVVAAALLVLYAVSGGLAGWLVVAAIAVLLAGLCAVEASPGWRLRGMDGPVGRL